jgi:glycosyltransferase involved in cell wall biosynthesis
MPDIRPWVAYVGPVEFPEGGAAARRILGNARALVEAGYDVVIVSGQPPAPGCEIFDVAPGIRCVSINERDAEHLPKVLRYARYALMGARSRRWLDTQTSLPAAVILYSGYSPYLMQFMGWARRRGVALLFDAVEWYSSQTAPGFMVSPYLWNTEFAMRVLIPRLDGVVAISRALEGYYRARGVSVGRVPPLFDPAEIASSQPEPATGAPLKLVYSGSPGRKDLIDLVIETVIQRDGGTGCLRLEIVGLSEEELCSRLPLRKRGGVIPDCLLAHGRVSHTRSMELVGQADFTVFLRHVDRVSTNGFPTKFVESLALGTPVITNITSDLAEHLRDGDTGLVCPDPTPAGLAVTLDRALELDTGGRNALRHAARAEAERAFGYGAFVETLGLLIDKSRRNANDKRTKS